MASLSWINVFWLFAYLVLVTVVALGVFQGRQQAIATYATAEAQAEWDVWREDAKKLAEDSGPVKRRFPKSVQPPALVLMRDHFAVCLGLALVLSTILFGTFMLLVRGALQSRSLTPSATNGGKKSSITSGPDDVGGLP
jgi:hypothetical protein